MESDDKRPSKMRVSETDGVYEREHAIGMGIAMMHFHRARRGDYLSAIDIDREMMGNVYRDAHSWAGRANGYSDGVRMAFPPSHRGYAEGIRLAMAAGEPLNGNGAAQSESQEVE